MTRINPVNIDAIDTDTKATLDAVKAQIGMVPNLFKVFAQSPAVLNANLAFAGALAKGVLTAQQREIIALATAQVNECHYCLSAHTLMGKSAGLSPDGIRAAREGKGDNAIDDAIATLARRVTEERGHLSDAELAAARLAGLSDAQIVEVVANVAHNVLTNFTNNVARTTIDFPVVDIALAA
ncbi:carboxymuconolactone decarboxylase family protein [Sphingomonas sp. GlSt437]|uniref:carboxymuconolactone decarboxylase family protein n=1 Tax=Sphingomonas sp. GlSt437 TaxID=3389970 RepID=UPI003A87D3F0